MGNLALLQVQALLVSMLAGVIAFSLGLATRVAPLPDEVIPDQFKQDRGTYFECVMVLAASMLAASVSSALVGSFMCVQVPVLAMLDLRIDRCALVVLSRKFSINPDNIATPLAASLGDLVALALLGVVSSALGHYEDTILSTGIMVALLFCVAFNVWLTMRNAYVQELLWSGWGPLLLAMVISSGTGLVLQRYVNAFKGYGLIAPVVTAVIGNVGAILVSRISTSLHSTTYATAPHMLTAVSLFIISAPVLGLFILFAVFSGQVDFSFVFTVLYTITCAFGVALSLCIGWALAVGLCELL
jgi:solute carrier family 41